MKSYVVCSTQRSGSTMFCSHLEALKNFGAPRERLLFLERNIKHLAGRQMQLKAMPLTESIKHAFLDSSSIDARMYGVKLMASTLRCFPRSEISTDKIVSEEDFFRKIAEFLSKHVGVEKYIYWRRKNKVAQALSHFYLRKTGVAHVYSERDEASYNEKANSFSIDIEGVERELYRLLVDEQLWSRFFVVNGIDPIVVYYEDFLESKSEKLFDVFQYLGFSLDGVDVEKECEDVGIKKISMNRDREALLEIESKFKKKYERSFGCFF